MTAGLPVDFRKKDHSETGVLQSWIEFRYMKERVLYLFHLF